MQTTFVTISMPTNDLERAYQFYWKGMNFKLVVETKKGERPEPVVFQVNSGLHFMLVPSDGFAWIAPGNQVARPGTSECVMALSLDSKDDVHALVEKARAAGATIPEEPSQKPWGYVGYFRDLDGHLWMAIYEG